MKTQETVSVAYKPISDIKEYDNNPRKNDKAVEYVAKSIQRYGFKVPIVVDANGVIICGHTRYRASKLIGLKEVPCIVADDLTDEQIKEFRIVDNRVSEFAEWDLSKLGMELDVLNDIVIADFQLGGLINEECYAINDEMIDSRTTHTTKEIQIGKYKLPVTDDGIEKMEKICKQYLEDNGVLFGLVEAMCNTYLSTK